MIVDQWETETNLNVLNNFESVLDVKWRGDLNLKTIFSNEKAD